MKKKQKFSMFFRVVMLAIIFVFSASTLSGCLLLGLIGDPDELGIGDDDFDGLDDDMEFGELDGLDGIKVCYKPKAGVWDEWDDINKLNDVSKSYFGVMSENILNGLFFTYFIPTFDSSYALSTAQGSYAFWDGHTDGSSLDKKVDGLLYYLGQNSTFTSTYVSVDRKDYANNVDYEIKIREIQENFFESVRFETTEMNVVDAENPSGFRTVVENTSKEWEWRLPTKLAGLESIFEFNNLSTAVIPMGYGSDYVGMRYYKEVYFTRSDLYGDYIPGYYLDNLVSGNLQQNFVNSFSQALEVNIYEIAMGRAPSKVDVSYGVGKNEMPTVKIGNIVLPSADGNALINTLKSDYQGYTSYVGLTSDARNKIKAHVSDVIIGTNAQKGPDGVAAKEVYFKPTGAAYGAVVDAIVEIAAKEVYIGGIVEGGSSDPDTDVTDTYPTAMIMDYPATSFFMGLDDKDPFKAMPRAEYQSFVLMPNREDELMALWLAFRYDAGDDGDDHVIPNSSLGINVSARYYDAEAKTVYKLTEHRISVPDGAYEPMGDDHLVMLDFVEDLGDSVKLVPFDNTIGDGILATGGKTKPITGIREKGKRAVRDYYELSQSSTGAGGVGILRAEMFGHNYLEILFDIERDPYNLNKNCKFQVAITGYFQAE